MRATHRCPKRVDTSRSPAGCRHRLQTKNPTYMVHPPPRGRTNNQTAFFRCTCVQYKGALDGHEHKHSNTCSQEHKEKRGGWGARRR